MALQRYQHAGAAPQTTLAVSMLSTDTTFTAASGSGYPDGSVGLFVVAVDSGLASEEKILCSSRAGAVFTVSGGVAGRGYDNTSAAAHTAPTATIEHVWSAAEADDTSRHIYATASVLSDDHTNYPLLTGARAFTGGVTINTGGLTVTAGGITVSAGTSALQAVTGTTLTGSGVVQGTALASTLTGTTGRYVGTTSGAPGSGTFSTNDFANDPTNGVIWQCTSGGTPGTWVQLGGLTDAAWTNVASFSNSWTSNGSPYNAVGYRKVNGRVHLRGVLVPGSAGSTAFTLPVGYRPSLAIAPGYVCLNGSSFGYLAISSGGVVTPTNSGAGAFDISEIGFDTL